MLGDISNALQNPSTSMHKKKKAAKDLDAITASLDVAMEKIGQAQKRVAPFSASAIAIAHKRLKAASQNNACAVTGPAETPVQKLQAFSNGTAGC